jgi:hypothetical protein
MSERVTHRCADEAEAIGETTNPNGSIGAITTVRLWRRVGSIPTTGNLVIYEDCVVFATVGPREVGWLSRIIGGSARDAQSLRIGGEQARLERRRLAARSRRNRRTAGSACLNQHAAASHGAPRTGLQVHSRGARVTSAAAWSATARPPDRGLATDADLVERNPLSIRRGASSRCSARTCSARSAGLGRSSPWAPDAVSAASISPVARSGTSTCKQGPFGARSALRRSARAAG